jgi:serine/threonine protein kinase
MKEMQTLVGMYVKDQPDEVLSDGTIVQSFMLVFPNKRRIYYFRTSEDKMRWMEAIKGVIEQERDLTIEYDIQEVLGKGKYGEVRRAFHRLSGKEVAIKIVNKRELSLRD